MRGRFYYPKFVERTISIFLLICNPQQKPNEQSIRGIFKSLDDEEMKRDLICRGKDDIFLTHRIFEEKWLGFTKLHLVIYLALGGFF